jgi:Ca2+-binding RTX toxin-like protein
MSQLNSTPFSQKLTKFYARRLLLLVFLIGFVSLAISDESGRTAPNPAPVLKITPVAVKGPGALYLAKVGNSVKFWTLTDLAAKLAGEVPLDATEPVFADITLSDSVSAIFYSTDLPLGDQLRLRFNGTLANKKCPTCTVVLPLNSATWPQAFGASNSEVKVTGNEDLTALVMQQNQIFDTARTVSMQLAEAETNYIEKQKEDLRDVYLQMKSATDQGEQLLDKSFAEAMGFAGQLANQSQQDTATVKSTANLYANYLLNQTALLQGAPRCMNLTGYWKLAEGLERDLRIAGYPDPLPETFDEETYLPLNREAIISQYENNHFPKLEGQLRPCIMNLVSGLYPEREDISFPGAIPNLSNENLVSPAAYELIGNNAADFVSRTDADATTFETSQTASFGQLDKLNYYLQFEKQMASLPKPLLNYVDPSWLQDDPPNILNAQMSTAKQKSNTTGITTGLAGAGQCGQDPVITFNLNGVSVLFGTPLDDQVTADNGNNLIITFRGDDCIDAKDGMDAVFAMNGADTVYGGDGHNFLFGGRGPDIVFGGKGNSYQITVGAVTLKFDIGGFISGGAGADTLDGSENKPLDPFGYADVILGDGLASDADSGADVIDGVKGINLIFGQGKNDTLKTTGFGRIGINGVPMPFGSLFWGGLGDDSITGTNTPAVIPTPGDFISAGAGNDVVSAGDGCDFVVGESGDDQLNGNANDDFIFAGPGLDMAHGNDGREIIAGGPDKDLLYSDAGAFAVMFGNAEADVLRGGPGVDVELGNAAADEMYGGDGPVDILAGMQGADTIKGENDTDLILAGDGDDKVNAGDGQVDLIFAGAGFDLVEGGPGVDVIFGMSNSAQDSPNQFCPNFVGDVEKLFGEDGMDFIWGNSGCDAIYGGPGINVLSGGDASDLLEGGDNTDFAWGGNGKDTINTNDGIDLAFGGAENDLIKGFKGIDVLGGGTGDDHLWGGTGADVLIGFDGKDTLEGEDDLNVLSGGNDADLLIGGNMIDIGFGGKQNDVVNGGDGLNVLFGNDDDDQLNGGSRTDVIFGDDGLDQIDGGSGDNLLFGGSGNDGVTGQGDGDLIFGGPGNDSLEGGYGNNLQFGNAGDDTIHAEYGRNLAIGGPDNDTITGGCNSESPRDFLFGNGGSNSLTGNKINSRDILVGGSKTRC